MAYIAGATVGAPHIDNFISTLSTFLQGNGWTLHDDISATEKVFLSTGQGKERIFIRYNKSGNAIRVNPYQYWDSVGHVGYNIASLDGDAQINADDVSAFNFWIWTDGRAIVATAKVGASYSGNLSGAATRIHDPNIGVLSSNVAAGAGVICAVDESFPAIWSVGKKLMVLDQSTVTVGAGEVGNEHATIVSAAPGQVVLNLAQDHQAGALIGFDPQPVFTHDTGPVDTGQSWFSPNGLVSWGGTGGTGPAFNGYKPMESIIANAAPDERTGRFLSQPLYLFQLAAGQKEIRAKLPGIFYPPATGIGAEDTTDLALGIYIALPIGDGLRMVWVPTF